MPAGARLDRIDIHSRRERIYTIQGRVTLHGDPAVAAVMVSPKDASANTQRLVAAARQGVFAVCGLSAGTYVLEALSNSETGAPTDQTTPRLGGRVEVTVANSNVGGVVVALESALAVSGNFRAEDGDLQNLAKSATPAPPPPSPYEAGFLACLTRGPDAGGPASKLGASPTTLKLSLDTYS